MNTLLSSFRKVIVLTALFVVLLSPFSSAEERVTQPEELPTERVVAVLVSVGRTENTRKMFTDVTDLDLLEVNGIPMIMHVYNALRNSRYVQKIIVVAAPEIEEVLGLEDDPMVSFVRDQGDAAENVRYGIDEISTNDLIMFIPSDLVLVTSEGLDRLIQRVLEEKDVDLFFPIVSREACERNYPEERRTYASFKEGDFTGAHVEFLRPELFLKNVDRVAANKDNLYNVYHMRKSTLGIVRFLGLKLTLKYLFGSLSPRDVEQHILENYRVTAKAIVWDDPDLTTDLSEPSDIQMIKRVLEKRSIAQTGPQSKGLTADKS
ncbi:MAG: hypothetical protein Kow0099_07560 [Candidatus Abyssubacteria bacterium]